MNFGGYKFYGINSGIAASLIIIWADMTHHDDLIMVDDGWY
jgi:L-fucose mutarotase/ribose pyranase (RbsD/FucU family)